MSKLDAARFPGRRRLRGFLASLTRFISHSFSLPHPLSPPLRCEIISSGLKRTPSRLPEIAAASSSSRASTQTAGTPRAALNPHAKWPIGNRNNPKGCRIFAGRLQILLITHHVAQGFAPSRPFPPPTHPPLPGPHRVCGSPSSPTAPAPASLSIALTTERLLWTRGSTNARSCSVRTGTAGGARRCSRTRGHAGARSSRTQCSARNRLFTRT